MSCAHTGAAALLFFLLPYRLGAAVMLDVRLAPFLVLFSLLPLAPRRGPAGAVPLWGALAVALATGALAAVEIRAASAEMDGFDRVLDATRDGARLLMLDFVGEEGRTFYPAYGHAGAYHRARHGGLAAFSFSELPHWPLRFRPGAGPPLRRERFWDHDPCGFRNALEGDHYDHVLVHGAVDPFAGGPPGPVWRKAVETATFTLWDKVPGARVEGPASLDGGPCARRGAP